MADPGSPARERLVAFEGSRNFRDIGGYPSRFGGATRWRTVYRSDRLHELTDVDLTHFAELGIRTVVDLRHDDERDRHPDPVPSEIVSLADAVANQSGPTDLTGVVERDHGAAFLRARYIAMIDHAAPEIGGIFRGLAGADALPTVVHCTAGKDRTGVVAALLLEVLGVDRELVLDDYELTDRYRPFDESSDVFRSLLARGLPPDAAAGVLGAHRSTMHGALTHLDEVHGGAERYLTVRAGVEPAVVDRLRELLIDRGGAVAAEAGRDG